MAFNADSSGPERLVSLVVVVAESENGANTPRDAVRGTYKIERCPPRGLSHAKGIAARYSISYKQLAAQWRETQTHVDNRVH